MLNPEIVAFANGDTTFYDACMSYFADGKKSVENKNLLDTAYFAEVERKSGVKYEKGTDINAWMSHPSVKWVK